MMDSHQIVSHIRVADSVKKKKISRTQIHSTDFHTIFVRNYSVPS